MSETEIDELFDTGEYSDELDIPKYGWKARFDWQPAVKCRPFKYPRWHQINGFVVPALRYLFYVYRPVKRAGKLPFIDSLNPQIWKPMYGVPMGGIGCGSIGRGFRGEFCRHSLVCGQYDYHVMHANQFIVTIRKHGSVVYQQVLSPLKSPCYELSGWNWQFPASCGAYLGLFPQAWSVYHIKLHKIKLFCHQVSPVISHNYKDSCLPVCSFIWHVYNYGDDALDVTLTMTCQALPNSRLSGILVDKDLKQIIIQASISNNHNLHLYNMGLKAHNSTTSVTTCDFTFASTKSLWDYLLSHSSVDAFPSSSAKIAVLSNTVSVAPRKLVQLTSLSICWYNPYVSFPTLPDVIYQRRYVRWFDPKPISLTTPESSNICCDQDQRMFLQPTSLLLKYAQDNLYDWIAAIKKWQAPILDNNSVVPSATLKSALLNELYFVVDGGTLWLDPVVPVSCNRRATAPAALYLLSDEGMPDDTDRALAARLQHKADYGIFGYLEGHEYRMYNTYDVHFYSSWSLVELWPHIQQSIQLDMADATRTHDNTSVRYVHSGRHECRSAAFCVPHDMGDPHEHPFLHVNAYCMYNTDQWKDLNPKFVLQVYRDWKVLGNDMLMKYQFPVVMEVIKQSLSWDKDGDGLIENSGYADQTYDAWTAHGLSAYTGCLWLCAVQATCEMARYLQHNCEFLDTVLCKAVSNFDTKLWTGSHYRYDDRSTSIMADQLCGLWYMDCSHLPSTVSDHGRLLPDQHVTQTLSSIVKHNCANQMNIAINGVSATNGNKDISSVQSEEFWVGVNYALASLLILRGMKNEGLKLAENCYKIVYEKFGLQYQTPEAFFDDGRYRSLGYMRPLSIWSIYRALSLTNANK